MWISLLIVFVASHEAEKFTTTTTPPTPSAQYTSDAVALFFKEFAEKIGVSLTILYRELQELAGWKGEDGKRMNSTSTILSTMHEKGGNNKKKFVTVYPESSTMHNPNHRANLMATFERLRKQIEDFSGNHTDHPC